MILRRSTALSFVALVFITVGTAQADNWPQWRGPNNDGISRETGVPYRWSRTENVAWRLPLPGPAGATPVVWGDRIFLTSASGNDLVLLCVSTDGKLLWQRELDSGNKLVRGDEGNFASPSPSTDGKHVWAFIGTGALACFDVDGREVWKLNVQDRYGKLNIAFGMTSTPVFDRGRLYLQLIHGEGNPRTREARVVCLDAATGREIWARERPSDAIDECEHSYASPVLYRDDKREFLLTHGADYVIAHRLDDGEEIWRCGNMNPKGTYNATLRFVASPVAVRGMIVVPSAKSGPVLCLRPEGRGDISEIREAYHWYRPRNTPDVSSPLVVDDIVYLCREQGVLITVDAKTGEELYEPKRLHDARHRASPVYADGRVYLSARDGTVTVVKHGRQFEVLAQNRIGEELAASPAVANGRIYLRSFSALYAIE
jgi:outer membrane protein assembly factor BamB